jgi:GrpB-like predicted nucleotidyltransferase (UPF0157 family)
MAWKEAPRVVVVAYDPAWPDVFGRIKASIETALRGIALTIEHVGSTSVPGLAAKPVIDLDVVVASDLDVEPAINALATVGYIHQGDLGVPGRQAFRRPIDQPRHHLYVVVKNNKAYLDHIVLRNYLRTHPDAKFTYEMLKRTAAQCFPDDIDSYIVAKSPFIEGILCLASREVIAKP